MFAREHINIDMKSTTEILALEPDLTADGAGSPLATAVGGGIKGSREHGDEVLVCCSIEAGWR